jgi:hypothetical protein
MPIATKDLSSNPVHREVYSIQYYVIKLFWDLRQVGGFLKGTPVSSINKTDRHDITEILLKVALNTININLRPWVRILLDIGVISEMLVHLYVFNKATMKYMMYSLI